MEFSSINEAVMVVFLAYTPITFVYYLVVLGCEALFNKLSRYFRLTERCSHFIRSMKDGIKETMEDVWCIGKGRNKNNNGHRGCHMLLHVLLPVMNVPVQKTVMTLSKFIHSATYYFSIDTGYRILDTGVVYLLLLLLAGIYLKWNGCRISTVFYYAVMGIVPCILTAFVMDNMELQNYKEEFCSDFGYK